MTEHEEFNALLKEVGLSRKELAEKLGFTYDSVRSQLALSKVLPRWAKSVLIFNEFKKQ